MLHASTNHRPSHAADFGFLRGRWHLSHMGYNLYITRRENWFEDEAGAIAVKEWLYLVHSDPEMRLDGYAEATVGSGSVVRVDDLTMAIWVGYSKHGHSGNLAWLWHAYGNIVAKNPDQEIRRKMWLLANRLSAKLQGDDGELYGADGEPVATEAATAAAFPKSKPWWRFW